MLSWQLCADVSDDQPETVLGLLQWCPCDRDSRVRNALSIRNIAVTDGNTLTDSHILFKIITSSHIFRLSSLPTSYKLPPSPLGKPHKHKLIVCIAASSKKAFRSEMSNLSVLSRTSPEQRRSTSTSSEPRLVALSLLPSYRSAQTMCRALTLSTSIGRLLPRQIARCRRRRSRFRQRSHGNLAEYRRYSSSRLFLHVKFAPRSSLARQLDDCRANSRFPPYTPREAESRGRHERSRDLYHN